MNMLYVTLGLIFAVSLIEIAVSWRNGARETAPAAKSRRALTNLSLLVISAVLNTVLLGASVATIPHLLKPMGVGLFVLLPLPEWVVWIAGFVALDLFAYGWHRLSHQVHWLWRLHSVHHADPHMDATTVVRAHPFHGLLTVLAAVVFSAAMGFPAEAVLAYQAVSTLIAVLHHTDLAWLPQRFDALLSRVFCTPRVHRTHHSQYERHHNSNYGGVFSLWDRCFGSFVHEPETISGGSDTPFKFGLSSVAPEFAVRLGHNLWLPFSSAVAAPRDLQVPPRTDRTG